MSNAVTRFFYDTEFHEDGKTIDLLSFGMVCENTDDEFYHVNLDADWKRAWENTWLRDNVLPSIKYEMYSTPYGLDFELQENYPVALTRHSMAMELINYVEKNLPENHVPEFWAYRGAYDFVAMAQMYGRMLDLPAFFPMFTMDIKQLMIMKGVSKSPIVQEGLVHNALDDAKHNLKVFNYLISNDIPMREEWI